MKYSPIDYAKVLVNFSNNQQFTNYSWLKYFIAILEKNNDLSLVNEIIDSYEMLNLKENDKKKIIVEYCGPSENLESIKKSFDDKADIIFKQNVSLKAGFRILIDDLRIDNSISRRLENLKAIMV